MYRLFGAQASGSAAIEIALAKCEVAVELISASSWQDGSGSDELKSINPLMQVPTLLLPDGTLLTESAAIMTWLGLAFPQSGLLAQAAPQRAVQLRSLAYIAANCYCAIGVIDYPQRWLPGASEEELARLQSGATARLHQCWDTFSDIFSSLAWQPTNPGAPEILASVVSRWSGARQHLRISRPDFYQSLLHIDAHPAVEPIAQRHWPASVA
jgi:GST-like protein